MIEEKDDFYETTDICIAAYLKTNNKKIEACVRTETGKFIFRFKDSAECHDLAIKFVNSDYRVFYDEIRNLKRFMFKI